MIARPFPPNHILAAWLMALPALASPAEAAPGDAPAQASTPANLLRNPGFEEIAPGGTPAGWTFSGGPGKASPPCPDPREGRSALRLAAQGRSVGWRQEIPDLPTRCYQASGWFRANHLRLDASAGKEWARLYFHILYRDRPYADATHAYADLPGGTYDWKRVSVRLVPRGEWPIDRIRVTVTGCFGEGTLDCDDLSLGAAPLRGGAFARDWLNGYRPVLLSDMGRCAPASALSGDTARGNWQIFDYEAGDIRGRMIWASAEAEAPALTLPLDASGWHAIFVGLADPSSLGCHALLRLTGDAAYVPRSRGAGQIEEAFFKVADLTGRSLQIAQESGGLGRPCGVAYVRLVPLAPEEVAAVQAERRDPSHRKLVTTIDGFSFLYARRPTSVDALLPEVEIYRHTDFDTLILQVGGADLVNYPSKIGEMRGQGLTMFARRGDRFYSEAVGELARKRINPTKTLIDGARDAGLKVHVGIRPAAWAHTQPLTGIFNSRFYQEHPEWRCVDRDGTPVARMSLAVPEVRSHLLEVLREAAGFGADGACVLYNRGVPLVLFERPFRDLFQQRHRADAIQLPEDDPRILALRAEILTAFMREIRAMLDEEMRRRADGRRLELSAFILANEEDNTRFGIDLRDWVARGLIDEVFPYLNAGGTSARLYDMKFFAEVCRPKKVRVRPAFVAWNSPDLPAVVRRSIDLYDSGADGITLWDGNSGADLTGRWSILSRLGHAEELRDSLDLQLPSPPKMHFHMLDGMILDGRYRPNWGY